MSRTFGVPTVGEEGAGRVDHFIMGGSGGIDSLGRMPAEVWLHRKDAC